MNVLQSLRFEVAYPPVPGRMKVKIIDLVETTAGFGVRVQYGSTGQTSLDSNWRVESVSRAEAEKAFFKLAAEQPDRGYTLVSQAG